MRMLAAVEVGNAPGAVARGVLAGVAVLLMLAACGDRRAAKPATELGTVEVTAKPDAAASLDADTVARPVGTGSAVAGALPLEFPRDVPLPKPSSLIDFSGRSVILEVGGSPAEALADYSRRLRDAGFGAEPGGRWRRGTRRLAVASRPASGGATHLVIEILPGG